MKHICRSGTRSEVASHNSEEELSIKTIRKSTETEPKYPKSFTQSDNVICTRKSFND